MSPTSPINIALAADENYAQHLGVALKSLLFNLPPDQPVNITVIGDNLSEVSVSLLNKIAEGDKISITFQEIDFEKFNKLNVGRYITRTTYARLALPDLIEGSKVLYLDCDLIVLSDISPLWNTDISGYYTAAVIEPLINIRKEYRQKIALPDGAEYFNSGVMLLNLEKCRQDNVMEKVYNTILQNPDDYYAYDQDGLNLAMCNRWLPLPPRWNVQDSMIKIFYSRKLRKKFQSEIINSVKAPAILHYSGPAKPWQYRCENPYVAEYYKFLDLTPWKDYKQTGWSFRQMLKKNRHLIKRQLKKNFLGYRL